MKTRLRDCVAVFFLFVLCAPAKAASWRELSETAKATVKEAIKWSGMILPPGVKLVKAIRDRDKINDLDTRLRELEKAVGEIPKLRNQIAKTRVALNEQREEFYLLLEELRGELIAGIDQLESLLDNLDKRIDLNEWLLTRLERRRFARARLLLATGRQIDGAIIDIPPNPAGIDSLLPSGHVLFKPGEVLAISTANVLYRWVDATKDFSDLTSNTADPTSIPKKAPRRPVKGVGDDSKEKLKQDLNTILDNKLTPGQVADLTDYALLRGLDWKELSKEFQQGLLVQKLAQDDRKRIRTIMRDNPGYREVDALRYLIHFLAAGEAP